jgi:predicted nuclease of predicted toxin-antitoxin system
MRVLADASVDLRLVRKLRALGLDVSAIIETAARTQDPDVLNLAATENVVLLTEDKDFGALVFNKAAPARGVVLIRARVVVDEDVDLIAVRLVDALGRADGHFVTLTAKRMRIRPLP